MKTKFHIEITQSVLEKSFNQNALDKIIQANIRQDQIKFQIGHDFIHFDGNAFIEGFKYISQQTKILYESIPNGDFKQAWISLGRILHSWQDFYSHSNYVHLWLQKIENPEPEKIDHKDQEIFGSPALHSGKNYGIFELLALTPGISNLVKPLMPADSHAKMNLDSPKSGSAFYYAYFAAKMMSEDIIEQVLDHTENQNMSLEKINTFLGK